MHLNSAQHFIYYRKNYSKRLSVWMPKDSLEKVNLKIVLNLVVSVEKLLLNT